MNGAGPRRRRTGAAAPLTRSTTPILEGPRRAVALGHLLRPLLAWAHELAAAALVPGPLALVPVRYRRTGR